MTIFCPVPDHCDRCRIALANQNKQHEGRTVFIDGRTAAGQWGNMCLVCWKMFGCGLGTGNGQMYDVATGQKIAG
jgi:hypothetical protein